MTYESAASHLNISLSFSSFLLLRVSFSPRFLLFLPCECMHSTNQHAEYFGGGGRESNGEEGNLNKIHINDLQIQLSSPSMKMKLSLSAPLLYEFIYVLFVCICLLLYGAHIRCYCDGNEDDETGEFCVWGRQNLKNKKQH
jgi:hypothetical protein